MFLHDRDGLAASLRLTQLTDLLVAQAGARSEAEIMSVAIEHGMRALHADTCSLYRLDAKGTTLELIEHRGTAPEIVERVRHVTEADSPEMFADLRAREITWVETPEDFARRYPKIRTTLADMDDAPRRARSFWTAPLVLDGRPAGLLAMGFYELRTFGAEERAFARAIANQCGVALERLEKLEAETARHAQYATTLRSIGDGVIVTGLAGQITLLNPVAERLTGILESEAVGKPLDEVFDIFAQKDDAVLRRRGSLPIPVEFTVAQITDAAGTASGLVIVFRDRTIAKRDAIRREFLASAGAELASSLDVRATLATVAGLAVPHLADWCTIDLIEPGQRSSQHIAVAHADPAKLEGARIYAEKYPSDPDAPFGVPEVIRSGKSELYPEVPQALLEASATSEEHLQLIREMKLESGLVVPLRGRERTIGAMSFIYADSGRRYTTDDLAFAEEFARRATMAIENARSLQEAETNRRDADLANTAKDSFLATVSHELRTPLNAMLGWTMALRDRHPSEDIDHGLAIIERNARRQARLIEDILDVSSIISGKLALNVAPLDLADVVSAAVESVAPAAKAKGVALQVDAESIALVADTGRLQQVLVNLLTNAVKFSPRESAVTLRAHRVNANVHIHVKDHGEGIAPQLLAQVFEPFRQADASTTRKHGGLGLGLAIVKQLVSAHGGTVEAKSAGRGQGTELVVVLPVRSNVVPVPPSSTPAAAAPPSEPASRRLDGLAVLVVDDEPDAAGMVEQFLSGLGATVTIATSAVDALEAILARKPDVVISDIGMPGMDGYAFLATLRALDAEQGGQTPAIALTAYAQPEDVAKVLAAGFRVHVAKPVEPADLAKVIADLAGRR